jgi:hypothetical protein
MGAAMRILKGIFIVKTVVDDLLARANAPSAVNVYCMATLVAEEAARIGQMSFAKSIEECLAEFLAELPREQQRLALKLSFEMAMTEDRSGAQPAAPKLRLVYSRA